MSFTIKLIRENKIRGKLTNFNQKKFFLKEFYTLVKEYNLQNRVEERVVMLEAWLDINSTMEYYKCGDFPFNFGFVNLNEAPDAKGVSDLINEWLDHIPQSKIPNWVLGNHDRKRLGTRYIRFQIRCQQYGKGPSINHVSR